MTAFALREVRGTPAIPRTDHSSGRFLVFMEAVKWRLHTSRFHAAIRRVFYRGKRGRVSDRVFAITVVLAPTHPRTPVFAKSLTESLVSVDTGHEELVREQRGPQRNEATRWLMSRSMSSDGIGTL